VFDAADGSANVCPPVVGTVRGKRRIAGAAEIRILDKLEPMTTEQPPGPGGAPDTSLATRYGAPKQPMPRRVRLLIIGAVLAAAVLGTAVFSLFTAAAPVTTKDVSFSIGNAASASVTFEVTKDPGTSVQCAVQVLSETYAVVGWKVVDIGPDPAPDGRDNGRTTTHTVDLRTESLGVSGGVNGCWVREE
jgi:hypothetical protein